MERIVALETQVDRIVSDIESEKATRARANDTIHGRVDKVNTRLLRIERIIWGAFGGLAMLEILLKWKT